MSSISLITQITFSPHKNPEMSINISIYMVDTYGHLMAYVQSNSGQLNDSGDANLWAAYTLDLLPSSLAGRYISVVARAPLELQPVGSTACRVVL